MHEQDAALLREGTDDDDENHRLQRAILSLQSRCTRGVLEACQFLRLIYRTRDALYQKALDLLAAGSRDAAQ